MLKRFLIRIINFLGFDIYKKPGKFYTNKLNLLDKYQINCILDVGANEGQYAEKLRKYGYSGKIISFEPQLNTFIKLSDKIKNDNNWTAYHFALGAENTVAELNISENTESSSLLEIREIHVETAPAAKYVGKETITLKKLDNVYNDLELQTQNVFLKIDTQGFEMEVLKGAEHILDKITGLQLEMSIVPMYAQEILFDEMIVYLKERNFVLYQMEASLVDERTGRLLQFDGIFFKENNQ